MTPHPETCRDPAADLAVCAAATPVGQVTMRLDRWIECRGPEGKFSIAEFEREADQEFFFLALSALSYWIRRAEDYRRMYESERDARAAALRAITPAAGDDVMNQPKGDSNG